MKKIPVVILVLVMGFFLILILTVPVNKYINRNEKKIDNDSSFGNSGNTVESEGGVQYMKDEFSGSGLADSRIPDDVYYNCSYSYTDIVNMVTDPEQLALLPEKGESGAAATSYDRASKYDEETDTYIKWADYEISNFNGSVPTQSNADGSGYIADVNDDRGAGILVADIKGAGAIFRSWFATVGDGNIDIYIDGAKEPTISMPTKEFVDPTKSPFYGLYNMVYTAAEGKNNYTPITFGKSCKIILRGGFGESGWGNYYQFSYRLFAKDVDVEPTGSTFTQEQKAALLVCNEKLGSCGEVPDTYEDETTAAADVEIPVGERVTVYKTEGEGAITQFKVKFNTVLTPGQREIAMQKLELSMYWDGEESPSVWTPFGDFFANPGGKFYRSMPLGLDSDRTFYCYWYMPYADSAEIVLENLSDMDYDIHVEVSSAPLKRDVDRYARFHAKWSLNRFLTERKDRVSDHTVLKVTGAGRFLGFDLHVYMITGGYWWGEGDEKFFVDGEKFPSTFGTGSEDYFGYAWGYADFFAKAFHAQNLTSGGSRTEHSAYNNVRFQIGDNVPFQTEFEASIEKFFDNNNVQYTTTAFFYLSADGVDPYTPVKYDGEEADYRYMSLDHVAAEAKMRKNCNSIEGEQMDVVSYNGTGNFTVQSMSQFGDSFSGDRQLWLYNNHQNDELILEFSLDEDYEGPLYGSFCTADDYGIAQLYLNGEKLGEPIDFYHKGVALLHMYKLGDVSMKAGVQQLKVKIVGTNEEGWRGYLFGLDRLVLGAHPVRYKEATAECPEHWACEDCNVLFADKYATTVLEISSDGDEITDKITGNSYPDEFRMQIAKE